MSHLIPSQYQLIHIHKFLNNGLQGLLIADDVGVGKTISAAYIILYNNLIKNKPGLVICPPILMYKWKNELEDKFNLNTRMIYNNETYLTALDEIEYIKAKTNVCYIMNNTIFLRKRSIKGSDKFSLLVIDEIHHFRNKNTLSYRMLNKFINYRKNIIGLTATPINNSLEDLISILSLIFNNYSIDTWTSVINEIVAKKENTSFNILMTKFNKSILKNYFTKRNIIDIHYAYKSEIKNRIDNLIFMKTGKIKDDGYPMELITYYRLFNSSSKAFYKSVNMKYDIYDQIKIDLLLNIINKIKSNVIIFSEFEETINYLEEKLNINHKVYIIHGKVPQHLRKGLINMFQKDKDSILLLSSVGSEGIDLQFCSNLINYDMHWNPMVIEQRIGRIDRIGQNKDFINIYNFLLKDSIDDKIIMVIKNKIDNIKIILNDNINIINMELSTMINYEIIKNYNRYIKQKEFNNIFNNNDYDIINNINIHYCNIDYFKNNVNNISSIININDIYEKWIFNNNKNKNKIINLLKEYDCGEKYEM